MRRTLAKQIRSVTVRIPKLRLTLFASAMKVSASPLGVLHVFISTCRTNSRSRGREIADATSTPKPTSATGRMARVVLVCCSPVHRNALIFWVKLDFLSRPAPACG